MFGISFRLASFEAFSSLYSAAANQERINLKVASLLKNGSRNARASESNL